MSPKLFLVLMTVIAVVSDSMLHPFYPQYFAAVFAVFDAEHVGFYIAACSLTVLSTFPLWALLSRRVDVLHLLLGTQFATLLLSLACSWTSSLFWFWILSLCMMVFKASYLLIYPYVISLEDKAQHVGTISLLAFVVYFGNILAALLGGTLFELVDPRFLFVAMAVGDALQIVVCLWLLGAPVGPLDPAQHPPNRSQEPSLPRRFLYKLGLVMLVMYFGAYLTEPFFASFWQGVSQSDNKIVAGIVFAIPGMAALVGLLVNARVRETASAYLRIIPSIALAIASVALQASGYLSGVLLGRAVYGFALFQAMVRLDALLFRLSTPETYSVDFSKINLFQGLGVLFASISAGSLVASFGLKSTFLVGALGLGAGALLYCGLFRKELWPGSVKRLERGALDAGGAIS